MEDVISELRGVVKVVNFGIIYGKSDFGLVDDLNIFVLKVKEYIESYFVKYYKIKEFMDIIVEKVSEDGYVVIILNRRRYILEIKLSNFMERNRGKRFVMNVLI